MRWFVPLAPLILMLSIGCPDGAAYTRTETRTLPLKAGGELRVKGFNGRIRVEAWNKEEVEVQAEIRENEKGEVSLRTESKDGLAEVVAERKGSGEASGLHFSFGSAGISYVLRVPAKSRALLETSNGQIQVQGLQADLEARTSNGQVELQELGANATVHTSNGSVQVEAVTGHVDVTTSNGSVEARRVKGELRITTSNGSVEVRDADGRTTVRTSNGAVVLEGIKASVVADSSNGSLRAERLAEDLRATTSNASLELAEVAGQVEARTTHGSIEARGLDGKGRGIRLQATDADISLDLGSLKGEIHARTSHHNRVDLRHQGLSATGEADKGEADLTVPGSSQRVELLTSNGTITIR